MLVCLDAGHCLSTPGKRCLKSIDPGETREWALNSRVADKLQPLLEALGCRVMRADDPTGQADVTLAKRVHAANAAGADLYLSIHHNAGIHGGDGGGIVVYTAPGSSQRSKEVQRAVYEATVAATGLRGNRASPTPEAPLYVLRHTAMPAVLGEFGFMDSTTDTPIILTEEFAAQAAQGIAAAVRSVYGLSPAEDQEYGCWLAHMGRYLEERAQLPASGWAGPYIQRVVDAGIMAEDGAGSIARPRDFVTREELATVAVAVMEAVKK